MDKTVVVHIYNGILLSYLKNSSEPVLMRWMKLETIIQNEVSQKEKHQYSILTHIYGIKKEDTDIKNRILDSVEDGRGGMI